MESLGYDRKLTMEGSRTTHVVAQQSSDETRMEVVWALHVVRPPGSLNLQFFPGDPGHVLTVVFLLVSLCRLLSLCDIPSSKDTLLGNLHLDNALIDSL